MPDEKDGKSWKTSESERRATSSYYYRNREAILVKLRERYYKNHKDRLEKAAELRKSKGYAGRPASYKRKLYHWNYRYRHISNLPPLDAKPSTCEVCGKSGGIVLDHCHELMTFRGWLCTPCNLILGHAKDDLNILANLSIYLKRNMVQ